MDILQLSKIIYECKKIITFTSSFTRTRESDDTVEYALIIDSQSLAYAVNSHTEMLRLLCSRCVAVLCCRMSPLQKAEVESCSLFNSDLSYTFFALILLLKYVFNLWHEGESEGNLLVTASPSLLHMVGALLVLFHKLPHSWENVFWLLPYPGLHDFLNIITWSALAVV